MIITVDGKKIEVQINDTIETIVDRIATKRNTISSHIYINPRDLEEGENYTTEDIDSILKGYSFEKLLEEKDALLQKFSSLSPKDLGLIWLINNRFPDSVKEFKQLDKATFITKEQTLENLKRYKAKLASDIDILKTKVQKHTEISKTMKKLKKTKLGKFQTTDIITEVYVKLPNDDLLVDIFDDIKVSRFVPFVVLKMGEQKYYKIFDKIKPPIKWLQEEYQKDNHIAIKLLKTQENKNYDDLDKMYTDVFWEERNVISIDSELESNVTKEVLQQRLFDALATIQPTIASSQQIAIKGNFEVTLSNFEKYVFLDMVTNDPLVSSQLFLNEFGIKSAFMKRRMYVYYYPHAEKDIDKALSLIITPYDEKIHVRISRARSEDHVEQFFLTFSRILSLYQDQKDEIIKIYSQFIEKSSVPTKTKTPTTKKKNGSNLDKLKSFDPEMFQAPFYARDICQKNHPDVLTEEKEVKSYKKKYGEESIMEFPLKNEGGKFVGSGTFYGCKDMFPGLKPNTAASRNRNKVDDELLKKVKTYEENYPFLPCCYPKSQTDKKTSGYKKYIDWLSGHPVAKPKQSAYVKTITDKQVSPGRDGKLPSNLSNLFSLKEDISESIRRHGVTNSPNSFIHCMELAFNEDQYKLVPDDMKEEYIKNIRKSFTDEFLGVAKQEMYSYSIDDITNYILDLDRYFDPSLFIKLMEQRYDCNIFLYMVDKDNANGNVVLPEHRNAYFMREMDPKKQSVIIIKFFNQNILWPYQCEIVRDLRPKSSSSFVIEDEKLIQTNISILEIFNTQKIIYGRKMVPFPPQQYSKLLNSANGQMVDSNGKVSGLSFRGGVYLAVSPCAPLPLPLLNSMKNVSEEKALEFVKKFDLKIRGRSPDKKALFVESESFAEAYIPVTELAKKYKVIESAIYMVIPKEKSKLEIMLENRKIATYLKEYTLFFYANNEGKISKENFIIDKNHKYDYEKLRKRLRMNNDIMFRDGKLIVPSKEVREKLLYHVNVQILNIPNLIERYQKKKLIEGHYQYVTDFDQRPDQLVFLDIDHVLYWMEYKSAESGTNRNIITNHLSSFQESPYFYADFRVANSRPLIIQNVLDGNLERALHVAKTWNDYGINEGYLAPKLEEKVSYGKHNLVVSNVKQLNVFEYMNGRYAAVLFFSDTQNPIPSQKGAGVKEWDTRGHLFLDKARKEGVDLPDDEIKAVLFEADPTNNNQYFSWIMNSYINGGIKRFEDIAGRTADALEKYVKLSKQKKLRKEDKNILDFCGLVSCYNEKGKMLRGLEDTLETYSEQLEEMKEKKEVESIDPSEKELIYDDSQIRIIQPLTEKAAG